MFPQLIAGPIVNYHLIQEQLHKRKHSMEKVESGLKVFALGLAYKVLLANRVGHLWTEVTAIGYDEYFHTAGMDEHCGIQPAVIF